MSILAERRERLITEIGTRYGVQLYPGQDAATITVSESGYEQLESAIMLDPTIDAVGRGYYTGLGGALTLRTAPDWTCDPQTVAFARLVAIVSRPFLRFARGIASIL
ncbi:hypothetical protein ACYX8G_19615 [Microbacterium saperdae]